MNQLAESSSPDPDPDALRKLAALAAEADTLARTKRASALVAHYQVLASEASRIRREGLNELVTQGYSQKQLAGELEMTRARISQLLSTGPQVERALLGTGPLHVSIGGKWEAQKAEPSAVISAESLSAYHLIGRVCNDYGLSTEYEVVPPPGMVRLNRPNLIVIGSPRLLPLVGQVLEADEHLGFVSGARGWYLIDHSTSTTYRSPSDRGEPLDYAYIGRLPRPDGRGTFLYLAGIHAMGTLGAANYVTENVAELYATVKSRRWSALVQCEYDADTRSITSTRLVTKIYTPGR
jgi:hypothetical protein